MNHFESTLDQPERGGLEFTQEEEGIIQLSKNPRPHISPEDLFNILKNPEWYPNVSIVDIQQEKKRESPEKNGDGIYRLDGIHREPINLEDKKYRHCNGTQCNGYDEELISADIEKFFQTKKPIIVMVCSHGYQSFSIIQEWGGGYKDKLGNIHYIVDVAGGMEGVAKYAKKSSQNKGMVKKKVFRPKNSSHSHRGNDYSGAI